MNTPPPKWCTTKGMRYYWLHPWKVPLNRLRARRFKKRLWQSGYITPNFRRTEARSKDGVAVPENLRGACQRHGFHMERVRHQCGDKPMTILSWYRSPSHNRTVGGASNSQHLYARACDISDLTRDRLGKSKFDAACNRVFRNGGIGVDSATAAVRHVDSRRGPVRWLY
jgi:uncharacterized protein YcbK (DUF882 family)